LGTATVAQHDAASTVPANATSIASTWSDVAIAADRWWSTGVITATTVNGTTAGDDENGPSANAADDERRWANTDEYDAAVDANAGHRLPNGAADDAAARR